MLSQPQSSSKTQKRLLPQDLYNTAHCNPLPLAFQRAIAFALPEISDNDKEGILQKILGFGPVAQRDSEQGGLVLFVQQSLRAIAQAAVSP